MKLSRLSCAAALPISSSVDLKIPLQMPQRKINSVREAAVPRHNNAIRRDIHPSIPPQPDGAYSTQPSQKHRRRVKHIHQYLLADQIPSFPWIYSTNRDTKRIRISSLRCTLSVPAGLKVSLHSGPVLCIPYILLQNCSCNYIDFGMKHRSRDFESCY